VRQARLRAGLCAAGFAAAVAIRIALLLSVRANYDTESFDIVTEIVQRGGDPYRETHRYNYSPLWAEILRAAASVADSAGLRRTTVLGVLLLAGDAATAILLYVLARRRRGPRGAALASLLFFANPVSILVSSSHLQFDGLAILFLVGAVALSERGRDLPAAAALSASLLVKHVTALHPLLFGRRGGWRGWAPVLAPYFVFVASFSPYFASRGEILERVFLYRGLTGNYGIEALVLLPGVPAWLPVAIFAVAVAIALVRLRREALPRASLLLFLVVLIFAPGFGRQYCVWPIALGALSAGPGFFLYSAVAGTFLVGATFRPEAIAALLPGWYGPWWAAIAWLLWELKRGRAIAARGKADKISGDP
jgi:ALG6, ALG8 glycosyltransferase family